jgi:hypothetical protein
MSRTIYGEVAGKRARQQDSRKERRFQRGGRGGARGKGPQGKNVNHGGDGGHGGKSGEGGGGWGLRGEELLAGEEESKTARGQENGNVFHRMYRMRWRGGFWQGTRKKTEIVLTGCTG